MSERHVAEKQVIPTADQQAVFDLMKERLFELFGPGGSFTIVLGRATADDAVFVSTVAETVAWQVAAAMETPSEKPAQHAAITETEPEHQQLWSHIEAELLRQRTSEESLAVATRAA